MLPFYVSINEMNLYTVVLFKSKTLANSLMLSWPLSLHIENTASPWYNLA